MILQMYDGGFVLLYRSILNWEWYGDKNTTLLFFHLILTANYMPGEWRGRRIEVGQRVTSLTKISQEIHMSEAYSGHYRARVHPKSLTASMLAWLARYNCQILFCKEENSGQVIHDVLYRELKERL